MRSRCIKNKFSVIRIAAQLRVHVEIIAWVVLFACVCLSPAAAQEQATTAENSARASAANSDRELRQRVAALETQVQELRQIVNALRTTRLSASASAPQRDVPPAVLHTAVLKSAFLEGALPPATESLAQSAPSAETARQPALSQEDAKNLGFLRDTTINLALDGYYEYNFNSPVGRVNLLRAYDVLSNNFSLNQASVVLEDAPSPAAGKRWGGRLDLQFGQATDTLQGNPANEPRPEIYRNIFQAYGTYVLPVGKGLNVDFGKWSSSLGIEGNYTKDQINYSRAYFFSFLPFYHMGVRASYPVSDGFTVNYWIVNGTNQAEATNGFKDELFGFTAKPHKTITWNFNYYLGQDNPDRIAVAPDSPIPVQPGLSFEAIRPAPDGRTHIFDSYVTWQARPKLTLALEGDYLIQRVWRDASPGHSSAPSHVDGGAAYAKYQLTGKAALGARAEYLSDHDGLFSGISQSLKENTLTFDYALADGFLMRYEWRRDFSNQPSFLTDVQNLLSKQQSTATVGLLWWWGRKEGAW
jgi:hypothetical protein